MEVKLYTDGGARGNPGPAAAGVNIILDKKEYVYGFYLGERTNNQAEYLALELGLKSVADLLKEGAFRAKVSVFMDSELIVRQLNGEYKVKDQLLQKHFSQVKSLIKEFAMVEFTHIPRKLNKTADSAVNKVLDIQDGIKTIN